MHRATDTLADFITAVILATLDAIRKGLNL